MGCSIHLYIEVKTKNGWELYSNPNIQRNYKFFAKLVGVRNKDIKPLFSLKNLPKDVSYLVKKSYEYWEKDLHHLSWINIDEIKKLQDWLYEEKPF